MTGDERRVEAKKKMEEAMQEYVFAEYGDRNHLLGDYVLSAVVLDFGETGSNQRNHYLHLGRGAFHSMRGLTEEQADWLIDLKEEEKADD